MKSIFGMFLPLSVLSVRLAEVDKVFRFLSADDAGVGYRLSLEGDAARSDAGDLLELVLAFVSVVLAEYRLDEAGLWQWLHTYCSIGNLSCKVHWCMVLRFERGNRLSVDFNGETIVDRAKYTLKKAEENPYGEYLITVPEEARKAVFEKVGDLPEAILNGYVSFSIINKGYEMKCLVITDTEGIGQKELHQSSTFRKVDEEHPARPLRWWSE